ncbi:RNA (Guanine-9-)-methyltransferase domain-containing protein [Nesidiocoris tenuis]|uniref:tRNA (guanine(9)-N(1))-methyltransferase n=1 Tax=Nesidiocoris tenuis TaxID=355587 RepID=A0ABN7AVQ8_9HEMI|nr:RNA (Guanine-9-)-methyltransferase domain-containing protein [Nesidiocoris tenuis]
MGEESPDKIVESGTEAGEVQQVETVSKRSRKRQLKKEKWLELRPIKRAKERERLRLRRKEAKINNVDLGLSRKAMKNFKMSSSDCKIRVCLDFSFDHLMGNKELNKCVNQMGRCYSANRRTKNPLQFFVTNFKGISKNIAEKHDGYSNWDVNFDEKHYSELFRKEELVYLSSESENVITELKEDEVYIIGALVDHNSQKGLCLRIAEENGLKHGRLPIDEFVQLKTRKVLTIDQVFSILANVACCGMSWKEAFLRIIPHRKGAKDKDDAESLGNEEEQDEPEDP